MKLDDLDGDQFLKEGWDEKGEKVHSYVVSEENHWTAEQVSLSFPLGDSWENSRIHG